MQKPFRKDLTHLTWDEVFGRQVQRAGLVGDWMDAHGPLLCPFSLLTGEVVGSIPTAPTT